MKTLLTYLCAMMVLTACAGLFVSTAHAKTNQNPRVTLQNGKSFKVVYSDSLKKFQFRVYQSPNDTLGSLIPMPENYTHPQPITQQSADNPNADIYAEIAESALIADAEGLAKHLQHCCYGGAPKFTVTIENGTFRNMASIDSHEPAPICCEKYYYSCRLFDYDTTAKSINYSSFPFERVYPIYASGCIDVRRYTFEYKDGNTYNLVTSSNSNFSNISNKRYDKCLELVKIEDLMDIGGLKRHNCCVMPTLANTLLFTPCPEEAVLDEEVEWKLGEDINIGNIDEFKIRYYLTYDDETNNVYTPRPPCHDRYQKAIYIDMVYNSRTRSFDRHEVKFDPAEHENNSIPSPY